MKQINIGLIGFGTIGSAVVGAIKKNGKSLGERLGCRINLKSVCDRDQRVFKGSGLNKKIIKKRADEILSDPAINVVIELIGGVHPAREMIIKALKNKKHVITANKALLSDYKKELFKVAEENGVGLYFEASVLAGVPVIKVLEESLAGNRVQSMWGIINGTSNYILSNMHSKGVEFKEALKEAQSKGYAEKNYSLDVEGFDSAHKLAIISSLAFRQDIKLEDIHVEGISSISSGDVMYAKELGYCIKLLAVAKASRDCIEVRVEPTLLPSQHMLSQVNNAYNAVYIKSDLAKDIFLYGQGAGGSSTSSAVVSDIADVVSDIKSGGASRRNFLSGRKEKVKRIKKVDENEACYYVRFMAIDRPGVLAKISGILAKHEISIASVMQKSREKVGAVPIVMLTHQVKEISLKKALKEIDRQKVIMAKSVVIKIEKEC
ncbi:MAG: homoserine dehydrogenase [Candidatus Omnitrophica bacterium]|nr:homoserine dehydrogenase [Candidatus Omnitrophota bacterium]